MREIKNIHASVHRRLQNKARESSRTFGELLQHYAIERFIYRVSKTPHADKFFLKGALMLRAWGGPGVRPTMDIDFLGRTDNSLQSIESIMKDVCEAVVEADGMSFDPDSVRTVTITEDAEYDGVRVRLQGRLGTARISIQVDIGFGDIVVPECKQVIYPTLLDFPAPELAGYSMESSIAEKFQAMVKLSQLNSRMKDFYDVWLLSRMFDFQGKVLMQAIVATFNRRMTALDSASDLFRTTLRRDKSKQSQWSAFLKKLKLEDCPDDFGSILDHMESFLVPPAEAVMTDENFDLFWNAPGPWK